MTILSQKYGQSLMDHMDEHCRMPYQLQFMIQQSHSVTSDRCLKQSFPI